MWHGAQSETVRLMRDLARSRRDLTVPTNDQLLHPLLRGGARSRVEEAPSAAFVFEILVGGTGHYLNQFAEFETSVLGVVRAYAPKGDHDR